MKQKKTGQNQFSPQETQLMEQLRAQPEMLARVQSIMQLVRNEDGPLKSADEVEELLIAEMRRLGSAAMHHWATQTEERVTLEMRRQDPTVLSRKKKR